jgi:hypothetical protein
VSADQLGGHFSLGGDLIYGIREGKEANGNTVAVAVEGVAGADADKVKLRLENLIRSSLKPRLIGYSIREIGLSNGNTAFIIRVPGSWNSPHVVEHEGHRRFYYRNSSGTHPKDVTELRYAMHFSETLLQRLEECWLDRLAKVAADESLATLAKVVLHLQPLDSVHPYTQVEVKLARREPELLPTIANPDHISHRPPEL